jgi:hypothetical protein
MIKYKKLTVIGVKKTCDIIYSFDQDLDALLERSESDGKYGEITTILERNHVLIDGKLEVHSAVIKVEKKNKSND